MGLSYCQIVLGGAILNHMYFQSVSNPCIHTVEVGNAVIQTINYNADNQKWYLERCTEQGIQVYNTALLNQTRAEIFLTHISFNTAKIKIIQYLADFSLNPFLVYAIDDTARMNCIKEYYYDTYNFILSLQNKRSDIGEY